MGNYKNMGDYTSYMNFTDEEVDLHIAQFDDDVDKYLMEYKVTGEYPNMYVTHILENGDVVTEKIDELIKIKLTKERKDKIIELDKKHKYNNK